MQVREAKPAPAGEERVAVGASAFQPLGWGAAAVILAVAFLVRVIVASELGRTALYQVPQLDQAEYLLWAKGLAAQGFSWPSIPSKGAGYALFLAFWWKLTGSLFAVRVVQAALGAGTCLLAAGMAARLFDRRAGLATGLALALYGPLVYIDTTLLAEGPLIFLLVAALAVYSSRWRGWVRAAVIGALLGIAALVRATAVLLLPVFALLAILDPRWDAESKGFRHPRRWLAAALVVLAGVAVILPINWEMGAVTGGRLLTQASGGLNYYMGNLPGRDGVPWARLGGEWNRLEAMAVAAGATTAVEQDRFYMAETRRAIAADIPGYLGTLARKLLWLFQAEEIRESHSFHFFTEQSRLLAWLPGFGLLLPLAGIGLWAAWKRRTLPLHLVAYTLVIAATCVFIVMASRYRLPLVPVLGIYAGAGVIVLADAARERRWRRLAALAAAGLALFALTQVRRHAPSHDLSEEWALTGLSLESQGKSADAEAAFRRALAANPRAALALAGLGRLELERGNLPAARRLLDQALAASPDFVIALFEKARLELREGNALAAEQALRAALKLQPDDVPSLELLGGILLQRGALDEAEPMLTRALEVRPGSAEAHLGLARLAGARRNPAAGLAHAREATRLAPGRADAWTALAFLALETGDTATAAEALARAEASSPGSPEVAWGQALLLRAQGRREELDTALRALLTRQPRFEPAARLLLANAAELGLEAEAREFLAGLRVE